MSVNRKLFLFKNCNLNDCDLLWYALLNDTVRSQSNIVSISDLVGMPQHLYTLHSLTKSKALATLCRIFNTLRISPCAKSINAFLPSSVALTFSSLMINSKRVLICVDINGAKRNRVQRDCIAGMILLR